MGHLAIFAIFMEPTSSVVYLSSGYLICCQSITSPRHAFFEAFFSCKKPTKYALGYSKGEHWGYYSCNEKEVKLLKLARKLPEDSKLWYELRRKLLQGCDLQELIHFLEVCALTEGLSS